MFDNTKVSSNLKDTYIVFKLIHKVSKLVYFTFYSIQEDGTSIINIGPTLRRRLISAISQAHVNKLNEKRHENIFNLLTIYGVKETISDWEIIMSSTKFQSLKEVKDYIKTDMNNYPSNMILNSTKGNYNTKHCSILKEDLFEELQSEEVIKRDMLNRDVYVSRHKKFKCCIYTTVPINTRREDIPKVIRNSIMKLIHNPDTRKANDSKLKIVNYLNKYKINDYTPKEWETSKLQEVPFIDLKSTMIKLLQEEKQFVLNYNYTYIPKINNIKQVA